ncbi:hypothetical protein OG372_04165 [Streptomyces sp. NBC_01020]|uniref:hypothetical protein n=1 Tax=Streptomyces sp. NBC_01020 TaxID=2903722 RepID=UPI00386BFA46|nr:hypothetical protein OG372_04165 [Streptomyces sp. NBC_01020]
MTAPAPLAEKSTEPVSPARRGRRPDVIAAIAGALLVAVAAVVGTVIQNADGTLHVAWPPLLADWLPHVGPGTPAALAVAAGVIVHGPVLAARLSWRTLTLVAYGTSLAWIWSLALVDGWQRGVANRLVNRNEYLSVIDRFAHIGPTLRTFNQHILIGHPHNWPAHVAGHPPGATLTFVWLDRIGLGGGGWAGVWCITVGASAAVAVLVALRALTSERTARRAAPFLVLAPAAVWIGTSADGYFAAVAAWAVALLALAATRTVRAPALVALAAGLLFGWTLYISYGLTLFAVPAVVVLLLARNARPLAPALAGVALVALAFTLAGFNWWEAYGLLVQRYYQGVGGDRPQSYWVWGNLACTVVITGLASVAGLRRAGASLPGAVRRWRGARDGAADRLGMLALAVLLALLIADLSGMSKAETERIWIPFALWMLPAAALLPAADRRRWLTLQALLALLVNHLLLTTW